jgi:glycosyltransferase involved in cell wall biosynthesis
MPRVLLIASDFPPSLTIAARRPLGLSRYLSECGWDPIVLTIRDTKRTKSDHPGIHLIQSDPIPKPQLVRKLVDRVHGRQENPQSNDPDLKTNSHYHDSSVERSWISKLRKIIFYPDRFFLSWYPAAVKEYLQRAKDIPVHAIISTAKPFTTHIIAKHIKNRIHVPWIADFRDLWPHWRFFQVDDYYNKTSNLLNRILLSRVLSTVDAMVAVTQPQRLLLERRFPTKSIYTIPNGFDPADYNGMPKLNTSKFFLTYTGQVRPDCQDPEILFKAISRLLQEKVIDRSIIRLRFYGEITHKLHADINKYQITDIVEATGVRRPRDEIISKQMESSLLLVFAALDPHNTGTATGKVYEYLAARRPILAIGKPAGEDVLEDIINKTRTGIYARRIDEIQETVTSAYHQFMTSKDVLYGGFQDQIDQFSYDKIARKYADILDGLHGHL